MRKFSVQNQAAFNSLKKSDILLQYRAEIKKEGCQINKDLQEAVKIYATRSHKELNGFLLDRSKDSLTAIFNDLLTTYINDKNSSTLREYITTAICGYKHLEAKIGYNGYRQTSINGKINDIFCEVKPKNIDSKEVQKYKNKERKSKLSLLNAGGNFTDYTWDRFDKDMSANPNMLISGFVDSRLIYLLPKHELRYYEEYIDRHLFKILVERDV